MASYNWKDHTDADLWRRYYDPAVSRRALAALERAPAVGRDFMGSARALARELQLPEPEELEFILELLLYARADASRTPFAQIFGGNRAFDGLVALRGSTDWGGATFECPRIFISHRQADYPEALRIAKIANEEGFQFWLDVLDPMITWLSTATAYPLGSRQYQLLVAVVVEMALLNCSHVIAVMTPNTIGSAWVPYEYGRAKDSSIYSLQAGCWLHPAVAHIPWEYLLLGVQTWHEDEIRRWLRAELLAWSWQYQNTQCREVAAGDWNPAWGSTSRLPDS
jgi:hypothetical protein